MNVNAGYGCSAGCCMNENALDGVSSLGGSGWLDSAGYSGASVGSCCSGADSVGACMKLKAGG